MQTAAKRYMTLICVLGLAVGCFCIWRFLSCLAGPWTPTYIGVFLVLVLLSWGCCCLPLYLREDCTVDLSFISVLATVLLLGPEAAALIKLITYPFVVIPSPDGSHREHFLNTSLRKNLFNMGNHSISYFLGGLAYYAAGGTPGDITLPYVLLPALLFIIMAMLSNVVVILLYFVLTQRIRIYPTFFHMFLTLIPSIGLSAPIGYFLAFLLNLPDGIWLSLLFMLPLLLARYSFRLYLDSQKHQQQIIRTLTAALEAKDEYTEGHSQRVEHYAVQVADQMKLSTRQRTWLSVAALFHDIGKIGVPDSILQKPGALTPEERAIIQAHPATGVRILKQLSGYEEIIPLVLHHHEFFDGRGYPDGTRGDELSIETYILSAADAYDAITSDRPYRKGSTPQQAAAILRAEAGRQFHPQVATILADMAEAGLLDRPDTNTQEEPTC
ncbi:HD-GYP domain-containing protein [Flavonifractor hominis]|uniref:HD-GYP domain-containing protein n=1 Tax=Flavonifractor hominis TaxID=3133178 RepID=A0ABV1EMA4_9FIRM